MKIFEIQRWTSSTSDGRRPFVEDGASGYMMSDEAEAALDELLEPYDNFSWYLDHVQHPWPDGPWCFVCLDKEYALAAHVTETRRDGVDLTRGVGFVPLASTPKPVPPDYCPGVGILAFQLKGTAETMASRSNVFECAWEAVKELPENRRWLVMIDALDPDWVEANSRNNHDRWVGSRTPS